MRKAPFSKNFTSLDRRRAGRSVRPVDSLVTSGIEALERRRAGILSTSTGSPSGTTTHTPSRTPDGHKNLPSHTQMSAASPRTVNPEEYAIKIKIRAVRHDSRALKNDDALLFRVASDNSKVFVTHNGQVVDLLVFSRHAVRAITFGTSHRSILLEIHDSSYLYIKHLNNDVFLQDFFRGTALWKYTGRTPDSLLLDTVQRLDKLRSSAAQPNGAAMARQETPARHRDPPTSMRTAKESPLPLPQPQPTETPRSATPTKPQTTPRSTRSLPFSPVAPQDAYSIPLRRSTRERRAPGTQLYFEPPVEEREKPAKFSPPLNFHFHDKKVFTVSLSDFRTLYNNEWINDTVIDFFIKYNIEQAINNGKFSAEDIYAFNSFFFTKLTSSDNHYENVKRWLNKIDLMLFPHIIVPINEHLHWYGCIIRGLPELLERKKLEASTGAAENTGHEQLLSNNAQHCTPAPIVPDPDQTHTTPTPDIPLSPDSSQTTSKEGPDVVEVTPGRKRAEIFIFDSLSQRHHNIHVPLKTFIIDYCLDKHNIAIRKDEIRIQHARVPRQNNFNDCGIHVIYNIKQWLWHSSEIEKVWRNYQRAAYRSYFVAEERNKMRRQLIDLLLKLHDEQVEVEQTHDSDDEIEVIEHTERQDPSQEPAKEAERVDGTKSETKPVDETVARSAPVETVATTDESIPRIEVSQKTLEANPPPITDSTLDPRRVKNPFVNNQVREVFTGLAIAPPVYNTINRIFPEANEEIPDDDKKRLTKLAASISSLDRHADEAVEAALSHWTKMSESVGQRRPKDASFVIHDENDDRLNQSVHDLSIRASSDDLVSEIMGVDAKRRRLNS